MRLHYTRQGSGQKLLLIHGFLEDSSMWDHLNLESQFDCLRVDLPGHGQSDEWPRSQANLEWVTDCILQSVQSAGFEDFHILGHSLGGYLMLHLAAHFPKAKLILMNSNFWTDSEEKQQDRLRVVDIVEKNRLYFIREAIPNLFYQRERYSEAIKQAIAIAQRCETTSIQSATIAMKNRKDFSSEIADLKDRILILQGAADPSTKLEEMTARAEGLTLKVIPNCGHMSHVENDGFVVKEVRKFLKDSV